MKKLTLGILLTLTCLSTVSASASEPVATCPAQHLTYIDKSEGGPGFYCSEQAQSQDLRSSKEFVATCPDEYLTYIDKSEGGPGAYCACPDENISYIDKHEGGPGFYCAK